MYKLTVFIPEQALESVKTALFAAGAGTIGHYQYCCWQVKGSGQFMPLTGSNPHIGAHNQVEIVEEWRVEMVVDKQKITTVIAALKRAHPYETPAYDVVEMLDL